jgi:hypothetical protein
MLSRRIVDFSVERSFAQTGQALREHYRIDVPRYTIGKVTAQVCREAKAHNSNKPATVTAAEVLVSEVDGSMLPVINTEPPNHRKARRIRTAENIESAHRHILQKRLKIPGVWWCLERAEEMAQLRALRANIRWDELWQQKAA